MGSPADQTISDETPFTVVSARILYGDRVTLEQFPRLVEAEATILGVAPAFRRVVLDSHMPSLSVGKRGGPEYSQPQREAWPV
jgi:hypothetical protein